MCVILFSLSFQTPSAHVCPLHCLILDICGFDTLEGLATSGSVGLTQQEKNKELFTKNLEILHLVYYISNSEE